MAAPFSQGFAAVPGPDGQITMASDVQFEVPQAGPTSKKTLQKPTASNVLDMADDNRVCFSCGKTAGAGAQILTCSRCKLINYCSTECQKGHYKHHKKHCKKLAHPHPCGDSSFVDDHGVSRVRLASRFNGCRDVLVVTGLGACGPEDFYFTAVQNGLLEAGFQVTTVATCDGESYAPYADPFEHVGAMLLKGRFCCCIVLGLGAADDDSDFWTSKTFKPAVQRWVTEGGTFLLQGERSVSKAFGWFGKPWRYTNYTRVEHKCFATGNAPTGHACPWYMSVAVAGKIQKSPGRDISVKGCLLSDVPTEECIYATGGSAVTQSLVPHMRGRSLQTGLCAVALGRCGAGYMGFFGDVNAESSTCTIVATLARGPHLRVAGRWRPTKTHFLDLDRIGKRIVITVLLVATRMDTQRAVDDANSGSVIPLEVWYHVLGMLTNAQLCGVWVDGENRP